MIEVLITREDLVKPRDVGRIVARLLARAQLREAVVRAVIDVANAPEGRQSGARSRDHPRCASDFGAIAVSGCAAREARSRGAPGRRGREPGAGAVRGSGGPARIGHEAKALARDGLELDLIRLGHLPTPATDVLGAWGPHQLAVDVPVDIREVQG